MGDTVYWVDESMLSDDEIALLATAQLQLTSETGELYAELPLSDVGFAGAIDERLEVVSDMNSRRQSDHSARRVCRADGWRGSRRGTFAVWL